MSFIDSASGHSCWDGYDYFKEKRVVEVAKISEEEYKGKVKGSSIYDVFINIHHPTKSTCNCPYAFGKRIICKHKVALFFTVFPKEAQRLLDLEDEYKRIDEENERRRKRAIEKYVDNLSEEERKAKLLAYLSEDENFRIEYRYVKSLPTVKLSTIVQAFDKINDEGELYVHVKTNKIIKYSLADMEIEDLHRFYRYYRENKDNLLLMPEQNELKLYEMVNEFVLSIKDIKMQNKLSHLITQDDYFRFYQILEQQNLLDQWQQFKNEKMIEKAIQFLDYHNIPFIDDINEDI